MAKVMFVPLSRFYAHKDTIGEDDVGRRRRGGGGGGRRRQGRARRGGGGQRRSGGGGQRKGAVSKPQRRHEPEEDRYEAMDGGAEEASYAEEEGGYYGEEAYDEEEYDEEEYDEEEYDPYDEFEPASLAGRRGWNPALPLGEHIQVRAAEGRRAAVKELEPGLWLVAELPDEEAVGAIALAPIILFAAKKALAKMGVAMADGERRGKLKEAVREAVLHAKARIKARRAERKAAKEQKRLRLPRPVEVGCRDKGRC